MRKPTGVKFCTMVSTKPNFIMPVQNFGGHIPKKFQGQKTCKIWSDFGRLRSSAANISETDKVIQNRIVIPFIAIPPALGKISTVSLVQWPWRFRCWIVPTQNAFFGRPYFGPKGVLRTRIFTRARELPSLTSTPPTEDGRSAYNFFQRGG